MPIIPLRATKHICGRYIQVTSPRAPQHCKLPNKKQFPFIFPIPLDSPRIAIQPTQRKMPSQVQLTIQTPSCRRPRLSKMKLKDIRGFACYKI